MKCQRCNNEIEKGELFCSNCGAKIEENTKEQEENTHVIKLDGLKDNNIDNDNDKDKDPFYQPGLEAKQGGPNGFLIFLIILLLGGIGYLLYDNNYFNIKGTNTGKPSDDKVITNNVTTVSYNNLLIDLDNSYSISYKDDKVYLNSQEISGVIYEIEDKYQDIVANIGEIITKISEPGFQVSSNNQLPTNSNIYEIIGTYNNENHIIYVLNISNKTLVLEFNCNNDKKDSAIKIVESTRINSAGVKDNFIYPELNLNPTGSQ